MAPKPKRSRFAAAAASDEGTLPDTQLVQRSTRIPGSRKGKADAAAAQVATPPSLEKAATSSSSEAARSLTPEVVGSADDLVPPPEAADPAGVEEDLSQPLEDAYDEDNHFKEKSQRYPYLWQSVQRLEEQESLSLKGDFLRMDDTTADTMNTEFKEIYAEKLKNLSWEKNIEKDVTELLMNIMEQME